MDTYKVATTGNSTSTMHKLTSEPLNISDFSFDKDLDNLVVYSTSVPHGGEYELVVRDAIDDVLCACENLRKLYIKTKDKRYWRALIQILPESYNQMRTWTGNYDTLRRIFFERKNHKLDEWFTFCSLITTLPYAPELICIEGEGKCY